MNFKKPKSDTEEPAEMVPPQTDIIEADIKKRSYFGPEVPTLELEYCEEELTEVRLQAYKAADDEYKSLQNKLDEMERAEVVPPQADIIEADIKKQSYFGPDVPTLELEYCKEELTEVQLQAYKAAADDEYKSLQNKLDEMEPAEVVPPQADIIEADIKKWSYFGPDVPTLELECWEEELTEVQLQANRAANDEYKKLQNKLDEMVNDTGGEIVYNGDQVTADPLLVKQPSMIPLADLPPFVSPPIDLPPPSVTGTSCEDKQKKLRSIRVVDEKKLMRLQHEQNSQLLLIKEKKATRKHCRQPSMIPLADLPPVGSPPSYLPPPSDARTSRVDKQKKVRFINVVDEKKLKRLQHEQNPQFLLEKEKKAKEPRKKKRQPSMIPLADLPPFGSPPIDLPPPSITGTSCEDKQKKVRSIRMVDEKKLMRLQHEQNSQLLLIKENKATRKHCRQPSMIPLADLPPVESPPIDPPPPSVAGTSCEDKQKKVRFIRMVDGKKLKRLQHEQNSQLLLKKEKKAKEPRKQKRKVSLPRTPCPLGPDVPPPPAELPPHKLQPNKKYRQIKKRLENQILEPMAGPSRVTPRNPERPTRCPKYDGSSMTPPPQKLKKYIFSPESGIQKLDELPAGVKVADVEVELIGFTSASSVGCPSPTGLNQMPGPFDEWEIIFDDSEGTVFPGSDIDDDDDIVLERGTLSSSTAHRIEADIDLDVENNLRRLDFLGDSVLRSMAGENDENLKFDWSSDPQKFLGKQETFTGQAGPTFDTQGMSPFDIFTQIWDEGIVDLIVRETNRYAHQILDVNPKHLGGWVDVSKTDIWIFFAVIMLQSIIRVPVEKEYWYPSLPHLKVGDFHARMSFDKFKKIKRFLHFVNNRTCTFDNSAENNKIRKLLPILDHLNKKFSSLYQPEQYIAIDESLLLWKGRLSFAQLIANKAARVGIKSYELCESRTGYLWKMILYTGKGESHGETNGNEPGGATAQIVYKLATPLFNKGHTLVMDNFYNSPLLSRMLKQQRTDTMGTLRLNREFVPDSLRAKTKADMRQGEVAASQTHDLSIVVWRDTNLVSLISSYHTVTIGGKEKHGHYKYKPQVVLDYNLHMGGVDKKDQMLQAFPIERIRNLVWYKKMFRRLLNISIYNSFVIYNNDKNKTQRTFRLALVDEILKKFQPPKPQLELRSRPKTQHFPTKNATGRLRCKWCGMKKVSSRTAYKCDTCNTNLCIVGCFREFHVFQEEMFN